MNDEFASFRVSKRASEVFASTEDAQSWMHTPLSDLGGKTPEDLLQEGRAADLMRLLDLLEAGFLG